MPHKKPHNSSINKKKGKNKKGGRNNNNNNSSTSNNNSNTSNAGNPRQQQQSSHVKALQSITNLPTFDNRKAKPDSNNEATTTGESEEAGGYYETYKASTTRFWDWMKQIPLVTTRGGNKMTGVNDLRKGADEILEQTVAFVEKGEDGGDENYDDNKNHEDLPMVIAPADIISDLDKSIQYRQMFTSAKFGSEAGGNEGHRYMIEVLKYCRSVLKFGRLVAKRTLKMKKSRKVAPERTSQDTETVTTTSTDDAEVMDAIGGRFNALLQIQDEEKEDDEPEDMETVEKDIRERNYPTYSGPEVEEDIDIQEVLVNGDDRFQAMALLHTMDDHMGAVDQHYGLLKNYMRGRGVGMQHEATSSLQLLMECAVAANMATESVQAAENSLATNHPHLSSFYHVLALVFLPNFIADMENMMMVFKSGREQQPHVALEFVAEIMECSFHNVGHKRIPGVLQVFIKKTGIPHHALEELAQNIFKITSIESQIAQEERMHASMMFQLRAAGMRSHMWLQQSPYIGGDRCILNTQGIVQRLMDVLQDTKTKLVGRPGFWGAHFDENTSPAGTFRGGLDEPFGSAILPELLEICRLAPLQRLPDKSHLLTVLDLLHKHVKSNNRTKQVPVALTFGLHALLTSIYVLQGDGDLARLASYSKQSFNNLFDQLDKLSDPFIPPQNAPIFYQNLAQWKQIGMFAKPITSIVDKNLVFVDPAYSEQLAIWNPLIGGEYLLYATYICSIGLGSASVDTLGQLRFTLHLYNALKQQDPSLKDIPLLKELDKAFSKTRAVWVGGKKPERGSFGKMFWIAWGMSASNAAQMVSAKHVGDDDFRSSFNGRRVKELRQLEAINPEDFSASYGRLVLQNFADEGGQASYTVQNVPAGVRKKYEGLLDTMTRVNATRDAMDDDEDCVIPINFSSVGSILLEFVMTLSDEMGWSEIIHHTLANNPEVRSGKTMGGNALRGFTASDLNFKVQGLAHFFGQILSQLDQDRHSSTDLFNPDKVAFFMKIFFGKVPKERYTFLQEKEEAKPKRRNPLEGSYPHGSTGRTARDPLHAISHYKYSKKGEPSFRVVTPGKLAPPNRDGIPYNGPSKLTRGRSGKYRHIASYSLDELMDLGWDGSLYTSSRARHAADGHYVPFIPGYDSDSEDEYEPIDIQRGRRAGTIGLSRDQVGLYMMIPDGRMVRLQDPKGRGR